MSFSAKVIADSVSKTRITTMELYYPRFIHSEFMTHRMFCRNASSSRAIPISRQIKMIEEDPAMPIHWGKNQAGMKAREECNERVKTWDWGGPDGSSFTREEAWVIARNNAIMMAKAFADAGYHKQIVNRILEPFAHIKVVVTATEWDNFFELRCHPDAQPEMQFLATLMREAYEASTPRRINIGQWHLPYILDEEFEKHPENVVIRASVARCARVSYLTHDGGQPIIERDLELYDQLVGATPLHASPAEHQAQPDLSTLWRPRDGGPLRGWVQLRKMIEKGWGR